jgi:hypothetical protein
MRMRMHRAAARPQVCVVSLKRGGLAVRCHAWDRDLGGRDIDELLFDHFCKEVRVRVCVCACACVFAAARLTA